MSENGQLFERDWISFVQPADLVDKNIVSQVLSSVDDKGNIYIQQVFPLEEEKPKVITELVNELTNQLVLKFDDDFSGWKKILVIAKPEYTKALNQKVRTQLQLLVEDLCIYGSDYEDTYYERRVGESDNIRSLTFIDSGSLASVAGLWFDYICIDSDLYENLEHPFSLSNDLNGFLHTLLMDRQGELVVFDTNPEFGKFSITKFKR